MSDANAIYITKEQILSMANGGGEGTGPDDCHDVVLEIATTNGDLVIHNAENLMSDDGRDFVGSGVYIDAAGSEHYSGGGEYVRSEQQDKFHADVDKWLDTNKRWDENPASEEM